MGWAVIGQVFYKMVIFLPYILFFISIISLVLGFRNKQRKIPAKKYFIAAAALVILAIIIFLVPFAVVLVTYLKAL